MKVTQHTDRVYRGQRIAVVFGDGAADTLHERIAECEQMAEKKVLPQAAAVMYTVELAEGEIQEFIDTPKWLPDGGEIIAYEPDRWDVGQRVFVPVVKVLWGEGKTPVFIQIDGHRRVRALGIEQTGWVLDL